MLSTRVVEKKSKDLTPGHLWSNSPEIKKVRISLLIFWLRTSLVIWILILLIALIYLGSGVNPSWHTKSLDVYVVDFDHSVAGSFFLQAFRNTPSGNQTLNWIFDQSFSLPASIVDRISNGKAWAAVYINSGTTNTLNQLIQSIVNGDASNFNYNPSSATTIVYDQGRNFNTINGYVLPPIRAAIAVASAQYSAYLKSQVLQQSKATLGNIITAIPLLDITNSPISYTNNNLHPAAPYAAVLATTLGYLFLWLIMLGLVAMAVRLTEPFAGKIKILEIVIIRILNTVLNGLIISLIYSLCVLWFADFHRPVPFIRFWLFNWLTCITFTVIIGLFVINLGALAQVGLTLFLITNLSSATTNVAIELQNRFYRVGYGLPLYHCFSGGRHFLFGSYTKLNVDIGVLFAYYFGAVALTIATGVIRMRKQEKLVLEKQRKEYLTKGNTQLKPSKK